MYKCWTLLLNVIMSATFQCMHDYVLFCAQHTLEEYVQEAIRPGPQLADSEGSFKFKDPVSRGGSQGNLPAVSSLNHTHTHLSTESVHVRSLAMQQCIN